MAFIEKEAKDPRSYVASRHYTASARAAMTHLMASRMTQDTRGILLPAYIGLSSIEGSGVFDPIRETGIPYAFYRVDEHLRPDIDDIETKLKTGNFQLVFLIHYFGCPQTDVDAFVRLSHLHGVQVIEDCAHTLLGGLTGKKLGSYGDYAIYSIHKSTSTRDGGFYIDNCGGLDGYPLLKRFEIAPETLATFASTDLDAASRQRQRNYASVAGWVAELPMLDMLFKDVPDGAVPLNCPVIVERGLREKLYFKLVEYGVLPTALYHTLIPELSRGQFPHSWFVADNILNLPTHSDIGVEHYDQYYEILTTSVKEVFKA